jgi:single-strand selective monofunctional uracil DNA glycosylase
VKLEDISRKLAREVTGLRFAEPTTHVYNPLVYARAPHELYLARWGAGKKPVILVGMNPGPFGMAQTGVPFGDVALVRDWLGVSAKVLRPEREHPKRPIQGFDCPRSEVSGARLWGWARERFGKPERFFAQFFVVNYCPLVFMEESGKNRTPDRLSPAEREPLFSACDRALRRIVSALEPARVIGVGTFAEQRARAALDDLGLPVAGILHPSPASPLANRGWSETIERQLREHGVELGGP